MILYIKLNFFAIYFNLTTNCSETLEILLSSKKIGFLNISSCAQSSFSYSSANNRYIVTAIDYFTKWPEARALKTAEAKEIVRFIYEEIVCRHGYSKKMLSDRGTHLIIIIW